MKRYTLFSFVIIAFILFQACDSSAKSNAHKLSQSLKGYYIYGHEVNTFQPCGGKNVYWVTSSNETLKNLIQKYEQYTSQPYEEVYVKIIGKYIDKATDGFATDYDGQVFVEKIITINKKSNKNCN